MRVCTLLDLFPLLFAKDVVLLDSSSGGLQFAVTWFSVSVRMECGYGNLHLLVQSHDSHLEKE